jgi:hypothetical protein
MSDQDKAAKSDSFVDAIAALVVISLAVLTAVVFLSNQ